MAVLEYAGRLLIIDCGVLFPEDHQPGVDLILPDFEYIKDRLDDIEAIVLAHGHEDHIGAVRDVPAPPASRHPADRLPAHARLHRGQAQGAPHLPGHPRGARGRHREGGRLRVRVHRREPLDPGRARGRGAHPARAPCCTPATSRWTSCRWTAGSPTCARSRGSARRGSTCSWWTPPTPRCPGSSRRNGVSARCWTRCSPPRPAVIVASFASHVHRVQQVSTRPTRTTAASPRGPLHGAHMGIASVLGYLTVPRRPGRRRRSTTPDDEWCSCRPARRVSRWPPCRGSRTATTRSAWAPATLRDHGVAPDPRQRECRVPRDQRADPARRPRRALRERPGARLRPRRRRRAPVLLQHPPAAQRHARARRGPAPGRQRRPRGADPRARRQRVGGRGRVVVDLVDGRARIVGAVPCGYVYVDGTSVGESTEMELKDRRILGEEGFISVFAVVTRPTAR